MRAVVDHFGHSLDNNDMNEKAIFWCLVALNSLDVLLTTLIIMDGGSEANPYMRLFIEQFSYYGIVIAKFPPLAILGIVIHFRWDQLRPSWQNSVKRILFALNLVFTCVIIYSVAVLFSVV